MAAEWSPFRAYGSGRGFFCWQDCLVLGLLTGCAFWLYVATAHQAAYRWSWPSCLRLVVVISSTGDFKPGLLLQGLFTTLRVGIWTFIFSLIVGTMAGLYAVRKHSWQALAYHGSLNLLRNTPPLIILFSLYFLIGNTLPTELIEDAIRDLPSFASRIIGWIFAPPGQIDKMFTAVIALGLYQSAYVAEIVRGSMESVPNSQWDAAYALGFGKWETMKMIIIPQGMRLALPPLTGQCITTFKDSSLASLISIPDLTFQSLEVMATTSMTFEVWSCAAILYLFLGILCAGAGHWLESRYSRHIQ